jgi:hypothetical protein
LVDPFNDDVKPTVVGDAKKQAAIVPVETMSTVFQSIKNTKGVGSKWTSIGKEPHTQSTTLPDWATTIEQMKVKGQ